MRRQRFSGGDRRDKQSYNPHERSENAGAVPGIAALTWATLAKLALSTPIIHTFGGEHKRQLFRLTTFLFCRFPSRPACSKPLQGAKRRNAAND